MKRRMLLIAWLALSLTAVPRVPALAHTVTLSQLRQQAPERLQMTVITDSGKTVTVDAPVVLPEESALPVLLCKQQPFDMSSLYEVYPLKKGTPSYTHYYGGADTARANASWLYCAKESKGYLLRGKTDASTRSPLPMGSVPAQNDFTREEALALLYQHIEMFGGDMSVDLRLNRMVAMSGLCRMKSVARKEGKVSYRVIVADSDRPVKGAEKGLWLMEVAQYLHGVRVLTLHYGTVPVTDPWVLPDPVFNVSRIMDEDNFHLVFSCLRQEEILEPDAPLLAWEELEEALRMRIQKDQLKSVYQIELGYTVALAAGDWQYLKNGAASDGMAYRYVLAPGWEIKGYSRTQDNQDRFDGINPDEETVLMDGFGYDYTLDRYRLRLSAATGREFTYEELCYPLEP